MKRAAEARKIRLARSAGTSKFHRENHFFWQCGTLVRALVRALVRDVRERIRQVLMWDVSAGHQCGTLVRSLGRDVSAGH